MGGIRTNTGTHAQRLTGKLPLCTPSQGSTCRGHSASIAAETPMHARPVLFVWVDHGALISQQRLHTQGMPRPGSPPQVRSRGAHRSSPPASAGRALHRPGYASRWRPNCQTSPPSAGREPWTPGDSIPRRTSATVDASTATSSRSPERSPRLTRRQARAGAGAGSPKRDHGHGPRIQQQPAEPTHPPKTRPDDHLDAGRQPMAWLSSPHRQAVATVRAPAAQSGCGPVDTPLLEPAGNLS